MYSPRSIQLGWFDLPQIGRTSWRWVDLVFLSTWERLIWYEWPSNSTIIYPTLKNSIKYVARNTASVLDTYCEKITAWVTVMIDLWLPSHTTRLSLRQNGWHCTPYDYFYVKDLTWPCRSVKQNCLMTGLALPWFIASTKAVGEYDQEARRGQHKGPICNLFASITVPCSITPPLIFDHGPTSHRLGICVSSIYPSEHW